MLPKRPLKITAFAALSLTLVGCASIVSGTKQSIKINSTPDAADVRIERLTLQQNLLEFEGKTPAKALLERKGSYLVTISLSGYEKAQIPLESGGMNGWVWGNILFGGIIGIIIDTVDGAAIMLKPEEINVNLVALRSTKRGEPEGVCAVLSTVAPDGRTLARTFPLKVAGRD